MDHPETYYNDLMTRYFSGEASEPEMETLHQWIRESPEHRQLFDACRKSWEALEQYSIQQKIDVDKEWDRFKAKLPAEDAPLAVEFTLSRTKDRSLIYRWVAIAAVLLIMAVSGFLIYRYSATVENVSLTASTDNREGKLPDGSQVTLGPGSSLVYPEKFNREQRVVKLKGEGYFEITHNPRQPFIIEAGQKVRIEVLGTSFYVNTCNADSLVEVVLTSGQVAVYRSDDPSQRILLQPGEKALISDQGPFSGKSVNDDINYMAWKSGKLVFENAPLKEVARQLGKVYHLQVRMENPEMGNCTLTATFENQTADAVLHVIEETLALKVTRKGDQITISGSGCTE